ncbi:MAG: hypothetical protein WBL72_07710 [Thermoguttaceae bacterium]
MTDLADLLADCDTCGVRLLPADNGGLTIDAPQDTLTPELIGCLKSHKAELLALLRPTPEEAQPAPTGDDSPKVTKPVCRCGSTTWHDVPIHDGQSVRRDCGRCGRFLDFPIWRGKDTLQTEK